jgi:hypothetical protein
MKIEYLQYVPFNFLYVRFSHVHLSLRFPRLPRYHLAVQHHPYLEVLLHLPQLMVLLVEARFPPRSPFRVLPLEARCHPRRPLPQ